MSIRDKLFDLLENQSSSRISGRELAESLGVSRTSVWKHMRELRAVGYPITGAARSGYRFSEAIDFSLRKPRWPRNLQSWIRYRYQLETTSTQTLARQAALHGAPEGSLWATEIQTRGRGRLDRAWDSSFGGLWFSFILRPDVAPAHVPPLSLMASLSWAESLQDICHVQSVVKWPNDILVVPPGGRPRKVAGILTQMSGELDRTHWVVMGIGVNVNNRLPAALVDRAVSVREQTGKMFSRADLLIGFLNRFLPSYREYVKAGFEKWRSSYWRRCNLRDQPVRIRTGEGFISGMARDVDASGALIVEFRRKNYRILEGEIVR